MTYDVLIFTGPDELLFEYEDVELIEAAALVNDHETIIEYAIETENYYGVIDEFGRRVVILEHDEPFPIQADQFIGNI